MAGNKNVPVFFQGVKVGEAAIDENGLIMGEIYTTNNSETFHKVKGLSLLEENDI